MKQFSKRRLFASACVALAMTGTSAAAADGSADVGEVVVTGSRIKRTAITGVGPATVVTEETIARTGVAKVETVLQRLPASVGGGYPHWRSNAAFSLSDANTDTMTCDLLGRRGYVRPQYTF